MLPESPTIDQVRKFFANDKFATEAAGCTIVEAAKGHAVCEMPLDRIHYNAQGGVMGGAIFTLADFCLAIACNVNEQPTVSVSNTIEFLSAARETSSSPNAPSTSQVGSLGFTRWTCPTTQAERSPA